MDAPPRGAFGAPSGGLPVGGAPCDELPCGWLPSGWLPLLASGGAPFDELPSGWLPLLLASGGVPFDELPLSGGAPFGWLLSESLLPELLFGACWSSELFCEESPCEE